jgi:hypothetical protein
MSRFHGRLRWAFTDDEAAELQQSHVVVRQRVFWVIILGAFLALLCLPAYRDLLYDQLTGVVTHQPPEWARVAVSLTASNRPAIQRVLREHPNDRDLQLGGMLVGDWRAASGPEQQFDRERVDLGSPRLQYLRRLTTQYPDDPALLATYLRYCTQNAVLIRRPENDPKSTFKPITQAVLQQVETCCARGMELDPDNGYFATILAVARFAAGKDDSARAALHQASLATRWTDYADAEMAAGKALMIEAYGDRGTVIHAGPAAGVLLPHLAQIRSVARVAVFQADQLLSRGELAHGHALHADVVRLGRLMRTSSQILIGRLVGGAVEAIGLRIHPEPGQHSKSAEEQKAARRAARQAYLQRVTREAPAYSAEIERANREQDEFIIRREELPESASYKGWDNLLRRLTWREILGLSLAANLGACLITWAVAALLSGLPWPRETAGPRLASWLTRSIHPVFRVIALVGLGVGMSLAVAWTIQGEVAGRLVLPLVTLPLFLRIAPRPKSGETSGRSLALVAVSTLGVVAAFTYSWPMNELREGWWKAVVTATALIESTDQTAEITNTAFAYMLPSGTLIGLALPAVVACFAVLRRWSLPALIERVRLVAKGFAAVLAASYLVYLLAAVPANRQETRAWDRMIEQEAQGHPL